MKHIIFTGSERTGKTLLAKMIFGTEETLWVSGRQSLMETSFLFEHRGKWTYNTIVIDDLRSYFNIESFYTTIFSSILKIDRQCREPITVTMPRFVFILESADLLPLDSASFQRRFHVLDFDKDPIADLMKIIKDEKIIIKTAR